MRSERRDFGRTSLDLTVELTVRESWQTLTGVARNVSLGGMFIELAAAPAFGAAVLVRVTLPGQRELLVLPGVVRWRGEGGVGVQFGSLGARETFAITQMQRG